MQSLVDALRRFELAVPDEAIVPLDRFRQALWEANSCLNLTRHVDIDSFVARDVLDAIKLAAPLQLGEHVLDVGSGGGVPGVLVAILRPDLQVVCSESVGKKVTALQNIVQRTGVSLQVHAGRAESLLAGQRFDSLTARAVGPMPRLLPWFQPFWDRIGRILLIKGPGWLRERGAARHMGLMQNLDLRRLSTYRAPHNQAESVILEIRAKIRP